MKYIFSLFFLATLINLQAQSDNTYSLKVVDGQESAITIFANLEDVTAESDFSNALISVLVPAGTGQTVQLLSNQSKVSSWIMQKVNQSEIKSICNLSGDHDLVQFHLTSGMSISGTADQKMLSFSLGTACTSEADIRLIDANSDDAVEKCLLDAGAVLTGSIDRDGNTSSAPTKGNYMKVKKGGAKINCSELNFRTTDLLSFTVQKRDNKARLDWTTENEQDLERFEIEASTDMTNFNYVDRVKAEGLPSQTREYFLVHADVSGFEENKPNKLYYRLKLVNNDGSFTYSDIRFVRFSSETDHAFAVYPNPTDNDFTIEVETPENALWTVDILGLDGRAYHSFSIDNNISKYKIDTENLKLTSGIYFIHVKENGTLITTDRVVITK
jgi:hypothetical protein